MNDPERAVLFGSLLLAVVLVGNAAMVALGVAAPILGHAEADVIVWFRGLIAGPGN